MTGMTRGVRRVARPRGAGDRRAPFATAWRFGVLSLFACQLGVATVADAQCTTCVGDADGDGNVTINELIQAVNNALDGCDGSATPTATASVPVVTPTTTPVQECAVTPGAWSAPAWATNAADALALRAQLGALTGASAMRGAEQGTVVLGGVQQLFDLYHAGDPSLADVANPGFDGIADESFAEFVAAINAGAGDPVDPSGNWAPGANGGIYGNSMRGMNAGGIEVRQIVDKGLFAGGALYRHALQLTEGPIDPATIDALAAAWGANETLDPSGTLVHSANYSRQMGFFAEMAAALTEAKAYAADGGCVAERDAAIVTFFRLWEQSMFARFVYYANLAKTLTGGNTGDNDEVEGLHQLSEGLGLVLGYRALPNAASGPLAGASRSSTDTEIDAIVAALRVNLADLNSSTTGLFIGQPDPYAAAVTAVENTVADIFDLDAAEIQSYRTPTAG